MRIRVECTIRRTETGPLWPITLGEGANAKTVEVPLTEFLDDGASVDSSEPVQLNSTSDGLDGKWLFRDRVLDVRGTVRVPAIEVPVRIKAAVLRLERGFERIRREVDAFENGTRLSIRRESIADSVRLFVWQRDSGRCVKCGSQERLEFDHIIPVALGGGNTDRNLQLLCVACNRTKGATI